MELAEPDQQPLVFASDDDEHAKSRFAELKQQFESDLKKLKAEVAAADSQQDKMAVLKRANPLPEYIDQLVQLSEDFKETPTALAAALESVSRSKGDVKDRNMKHLIVRFSDRLNFGKIAATLFEQAPSQDIENWLRLMVEHSPAGKGRALAIMNFSTYIKNLPEYQSAFAKNPQLLAKLGAEQQQYLAADPKPETIAEVGVLLREVIASHPKLAYRRGKTYGEAAAGDLFELENLRIGQSAPDIVGTDLDGIEFKLSDYAGKIVMLDFWGHWCGPCRAMYSEERELVRRLAGTDFVLLGMNSDRRLGFARDAVSDEGLSWRHFWNGADGTSGPIASAWNIDAWPTVYLIDGDGVIRYKDVLGEDLLNALEVLLAESGHQVDLSDLN